MNAAGVLSARINDLGGGGSTNFGAVSGISTAARDGRRGADRDAVAVLGDGYSVVLPRGLAVGESRTSPSSHRTQPGGTLVDSAMSCTVNSGQDDCSYNQIVAFGALLVKWRFRAPVRG